MHNLAATGHAPHDRWLHFCPMFHVAGTSNVFACTWVGATRSSCRGSMPAAVLETIERERHHARRFVPTMLAMLLEHATGHVPLCGTSSTRRRRSRPSCSGACWRGSDCDVVQFYGMTEAAPTVTRLSARGPRTRPGRASMGVPVPGVQAEVRAPRGDVGELWVRGPNVMLGYWNRPEATAAALVDGWYRTGDLAREDGTATCSWSTAPRT